jgi:hypothetical protein
MRLADETGELSGHSDVLVCEGAAAQTIQRQRTEVGLRDQWDGHLMPHIDRAESDLVQVRMAELALTGKVFQPHGTESAIGHIIIAGMLQGDRMLACSMM